MLILSLTLAGSLGPPIQRPAETQPLVWAAPAECPKQDALRERVHALSPGLLDAANAAGSEVEIEVRADAEGYATRVRVRNEEGETRREFVAHDCEIAMNASALILAVILDPVAVSESLRASELEPEPEPTSEAAPEPPEPEPEPEPAPASEHDAALIVDVPEPARELRPRRLRFGLRTLAGGGYGPLRAGQATIAGWFAVIGPRWRAELGGQWAIPRVIRLPDGRGGGSFDAWAVVGRGCFAPRLGRLELPSCAGVELGAVRGRGLADLPVATRASFLWVAIEATQGLWFSPVERVGLGVELQLAVPLNRGAFAIDTTEVQRIGPISARGLAGVELRW